MEINVGLVRFELTIDGSLRTLEEFKENTNQCSNGSSQACPVELASVDPLLIIYPLEPVAIPD